MGHVAGIRAHGLWSVSRGLARGLEDRSEYKSMMDMADTPRQNDIDGRGNLSQRSLSEFVLWFLRVCLDQVRFMATLFDLDSLATRLVAFAERDDRLRPAAGKLLEEAAIRGELERGDASRITGLPERTARRVLNETIGQGLLASETPKGRVFLQFPPGAAEVLFPRLFVE
jgi:Fic family protein